MPSKRLNPTLESDMRSGRVTPGYLTDTERHKMIGSGFAAGIVSHAVARYAKYAIAGLFFTITIAALAGYQFALYRECRAVHPWWYCVAER